MQRRVNALMPLYNMTTPFIQAIKAAVSRIIGNMSPATRPPCVPLSAETAEAIRRFTDDEILGGKKP
jgi:dihydrodipicolinate synthase/N-acetylneuraminate lyase